MNPGGDKDRNLTLVHRLPDADDDQEQFKPLEWGIIRRLHKRGERREFFESLSDVWEMFSIIAAERHSLCADEGSDSSVPATPCAQIKWCGSSLRNRSTRHFNRRNTSSIRTSNQSSPSADPFRLIGGFTSSHVS